MRAACRFVDGAESQFFPLGRARIPGFLTPHGTGLSPLRGEGVQKAIDLERSARCGDLGYGCRIESAWARKYRSHAPISVAISRARVSAAYSAIVRPQ